MNGEQYLTNKHAILSSPGQKYNDAYYSTANSSVSMVELTYGWPKVQSLSSLSFGSNSTVYIDRNNFVGPMLLHLRLPRLVANQSLVRGWGYGCIDYISYQLGSSNSTSIQLQGDGIYQAAMAQLKSGEKRLEVLRLSGEERLNDANLLNDAYVLIPLPFSTYCDDTLPIDTQMLQNNISITIQFKQDPRCVYGGSAVAPTQFLIAETMIRNGELSDKAKSLSNALIMNPELKYNMPFIHIQSFQSAPFVGVPEGSGGTCNVQLNQFANADLTCITFYAIKNSDKFATGNNTPNPFNCDEVSNIVLRWGGQTLANYPAKVYKLTNMLSEGQDSSAIPSMLVNPGTGPDFVSSGRDCYMVIFDFSQQRSVCLQSHFYNTRRLTNQTLDLSFNTTSSDTYRVYATYYYNAVAELSNLTSSIYID